MLSLMTITRERQDKAKPTLGTVRASPLQTESEQNRCATALAGHRAAILFTFSLMEKQILFCRTLEFYGENDSEIYRII